MPKWLLLALPLFMSGCLFDEDPEVLRLSGKTMGTTYNITAIGVDLADDEIAAAVETSLAGVNAKMSNWDPKSEVSTFSASPNTDPTPVSAEFVTVMTAANTVHDQSGGKFDVTLGPLIELWGFGPRKPEDPIPSDADINAALTAVSQSKLLTLDTDKSTLGKSAAGVGINLSAIAKGYGVDAVAETLVGFGVENYMVEIGGDLVTKGQNDKGEDWRIGIEKPDAAAQTVQLIVPVSDFGLATSGDYRNFFEQDGIRYSHIIDPTTGRPITHRTTSVTVLTDNAMMADAWATAMLVLGQENGLKVAEAHELAVFFISRDGQTGSESYTTAQSSAFTKLLGE
ncbi:FAD:protein FMN transferase [Phaeobacter gallaeciensis]|uniref:FAD:protein FMN transferase n=2 Tax=Roseobacteraceae TaxID=2854170 RepID=A0A366X948_9RHOB|nr:MULTISPECIES: FAD:protein FMN transferase [Roseobacteraceae]MBT3142555.1 FAD:protein FMN transferase [Falsiruegeria litorea]MBT8169217.1 FAD:protein FMN transferase [Falsiruegeria litorea]RBW60460.1 FAD:protein FMN transferase [Phaeobacter gallaeciensis]